jgi:lysozyme
MAHTNRDMRRFFSLAVAFGLIFMLAGCHGEPEPTPTVDPHAGQVQVADGMGGTMWVTLHENLPVSDLEAGDFTVSDGYVSYQGDDYVALSGIDVSFYQGEIDWQQVADSGIQFALIRAGYRGYSEGQLFEDEYFRQNIDGAKAAGLAVGVYFFSQATSMAEAQEEAAFVLELVDGYHLELPVVFDWERVHGVEGGARTDDVAGKTLTDSCLAFCEAIRGAGFEPAVYFYRDLGYNLYELDRLEGLKFWVGALGEYPDFYYEHGIWQYSITGQVPGIAGDVDLDLYFIHILGEN